MIKYSLAQRQASKLCDDLFCSLLDSYEKTQYCPEYKWSQCLI